VIIGETPNYQTLQERKEGRVYRQNLDRPERLNSLNATMVCDLTIIWSA
jgi:enoyl-CoA hydratase/carnithine racemase